MTQKAMTQKAITRKAISQKASSREAGAPRPLAINDFVAIPIAILRPAPGS